MGLMSRVVVVRKKLKFGTRGQANPSKVVSEWGG